jgi:3-methyladenine DNA glycosylase AlkD
MANMPQAASKLSAGAVKNALAAAADVGRAQGAQKYFKTGPGEYGQGDVFIGVTVPDQRRVAKTYLELPDRDLVTLLKSKIHEHRNTACLIMALRAQKADRQQLRELLDIYLGNTHRINNWDLVDSSAPDVVGRAFMAKLVTQSQLRSLAKSDLLWERRIAVLATFASIREGNFAPTLDLAKRLLNDEHDLMHKAVGWMLREVGNRSSDTLRAFLDSYTPLMPRTMLRYAIERLPEDIRTSYMKIPRKASR